MALDFDPAFFQDAASQFQTAAQNALPTQGEQESASNRLTSRLAAAQASNQRQLQSQFAGLGRGRSGALQQRLGENRGQTLGALGSGLADIDADFGRRRQEGAGLLANIGTGLAGLGAASNQAQLGFGQLGVSQQQANTFAEQVANQLQLGLGQLELGQGQLGVAQQQADTGQFTAETGRLGTEGQLGIAQQQTDIQAAQQAAEEQIGTGRLGLEEEALAQSELNQRIQNLIEGFTSIGAIGNIAGAEGTTDEFNAQFNNFLEALFGELGVSFPGGAT